MARKRAESTGERPTPRRRTTKQATQSTAKTSATDAAAQTRPAAAAKTSTGIGRPTCPEQHIRERAYYIFLRRGGNDGDPVRDWLEAERELLSAST